MRCKWCNEKIKSDLFFDHVHLNGFIRCTVGVPHYAEPRPEYLDVLEILTKYEDGEQKVELS